MAIHHPEATSSMASLFTVIISTAIIGGLGLCLYSRYNHKPKMSMPPGPRRLPLLGNFFDMPRGYQWLFWSKYKSIYGPISSLSVFGQNLIIINDQECAVDLLEKRSAVYSGRTQQHFLNMCGWNSVTTFLQPGEELLAHRRNMLQYIGKKKALKAHQLLQELESRRFILRILDKPSELFSQLSIWSAAVILKVSYGYSIDTCKSDPLVKLIKSSASYLTSSAQPGVWLVDVIPALRFIPDWIPGIYFKRFARDSRVSAQQLVNMPFRFVQHQLDAGTEDDSFSAHFLKNPDSDISALMWAAVSLFLGGTESSLAAMSAFFLAMTVHPEIQAKAQAEIDSIVGLDRLPIASDRPNLPYIDALLKELIRWHTVTPLNVGHVAAHDDVYRGYLIPKGSTLLVNIWFINHDPENYSDPFEFRPERFLEAGANILNPRDSSFGYGRRICPGRYFADASFFTAVSNCLATLNITKAVDKDGQELQPMHEVTDALASHPKPFPCSILARSPKSKELLVSAVKEANEAYGFNSHADVLHSLF